MYAGRDEPGVQAEAAAAAYHPSATCTWQSNTPHPQVLAFTQPFMKWPEGGGIRLHLQHGCLQASLAGMGHPGATSAVITSVPALPLCATGRVLHRASTASMDGSAARLPLAGPACADSSQRAAAAPLAGAAAAAAPQLGCFCCCCAAAAYLLQGEQQGHGGEAKHVSRLWCFQAVSVLERERIGSAQQSFTGAAPAPTHAPGQEARGWQSCCADSALLHAEACSPVATVAEAGAAAGWAGSSAGQMRHAPGTGAGKQCAWLAARTRTASQLPPRIAPSPAESPIKSESVPRRHGPARSPLGRLAVAAVLDGAHAHDLGVDGRRHAVVDLAVDLGQGVACGRVRVGWGRAMRTGKRHLECTAGGRVWKRGRHARILGRVVLQLLRVCHAAPLAVASQRGCSA